MGTLPRYLDTFDEYVVQTNDTPPLLILLVGLFVVLSIALVAPLACWSRERGQHEKVEREHGTHASMNTVPENGYPTPDESVLDADRDMLDSQHNGPQHQQLQQSPEKQGNLIEEGPPPNVADLSIFHNEHLAAMKLMATERRMGKLFQPTSYSFPQVLRDRLSDPNNADKLSAVQSVATTSRLHGPGNSKKKPFKSRIPWSHSRPIPRIATVQRSVLLERHSVASEEGSQSHHSRTRNSWVAGQGHPGRGKVVSEAAGIFLDRHGVEGEADYYRQRYINRSNPNNRSTVNRSYGGRGSRPPSIGGSDIGSVMPPLSPSVLSPQDAADANDPGRIPDPIQYQSYARTTTTETMSHSRDISGILSAQFVNILDVAELDYQCSRLVYLAVPTTIGAMADPLYRIILVAIISHFIDTDSMVAFLLVILFIRLTTEEISGAISDAESNIVQDFLMEGGECSFHQAGQTIQLAIFFQIVIGAPVLLMWFFVMEKVVFGLVNDADIARIASDYTGVIIIDYVIRAASRSFMLPFHLTGQAQFEAKIDLVATIMTGAAIAIVATTNDLSLPAIGWVQVIIGIAKAITKVSYVCMRGWLKPYRNGLLNSWACRNTAFVVNFLLQAFPLFLGSLLELGEWEVLVLFVGQLGGAEVATWAMMGVMWEIFAALTEGLGEAASVRVSYFLIEGMHLEARKLANKVAFFALIQVLALTSIFLMAGPNIAVLLSIDSTIQHLFTQLVGMAALANVSMTFAQVYWSLAGAQGNFGLASATILFCRWLVILPIASIFIFRYTFDLLAVAASVAVGYAFASMLLAWWVFRRDWEALALSLRDIDGMDGLDGDMNLTGKAFLNEPVDEEDEDDYDEDDDEEDEEESSCSSLDDHEESSFSADEEEMGNGPGRSSTLEETECKTIRNDNDLV